jgi:hypothetical protein
MVGDGVNGINDDRELIDERFELFFELPLDEGIIYIMSIFYFIFRKIFINF